MRPDDVREFSMSLPEATESPHFDMSSFRVHGKIFATLPPDDAHAHIFVDELATAAAVTDDPTSFAELWWGKKLSGVRVTLDHADPRAVNELLEESWRRRARKQLIAQYDESRELDIGDEVGDDTRRR
jgi:hypothetical protein